MELLIAVAAAAVFAGGVSKGLNGFGHALIATSLTAVVLPAPEAVALIIPSLIAANIELANSLEKKELIRCTRRFKYYILAILAGVTAGMAAIDYIPVSVLKAAIGVFAVVYAVSRMQRFEALNARVQDICFRSHESFIGLLTGVVYGSTNVALPAVSYLESRDLSLRQFKGVLAFVILGVSVYRLALASALGFFPGTDRLMLAAGLAVPAVIGVKMGEGLSGRLNKEVVRKFSLLLIAVIGLRLLASF